jgi:hypothetical protein
LTLDHAPDSVLPRLNQLAQAVVAVPDRAVQAVAVDIYNLVSSLFSTTHLLPLSINYLILF